MNKPGYGPIRWRKRTTGRSYESTWPMGVWVLTRLTATGGWSVCRANPDSPGYSMVMICQTIQLAKRFANDWTLQDRVSR